MPNIASVLKSEVTRLARKELRSQTEGLKQALSATRAEVSGLKQRVHALEREVRKLQTAAHRAQKATPTTVSSADSGTKLRFRPQGMAANRKRLGLSANDFGLLVGATGQTIYAWEAGKSKPKPENLLAIAGLRGLGKREVAAKLEALGQA